MNSPVLSLLAAAGAAVALLAGLPAQASNAGATQADMARELAKIRQATQRFRDIHVALAEGYVIPPPAACVSAKAEGEPRQLGAMGVHVIDNPATPADEAHGFTPHYELHIWLYRENPAGMFMPFNTRVSCPDGHTH